MKQKDKELLLRYMSMALPYGVVVETQLVNAPRAKYPVLKVLQSYMLCDFMQTIENVIHKPYLRPMSSMTEEEDEKRIQLGIWRSSQTNGFEVTRISPNIPECYNSQAFQNALGFLLREHFDIFGLIPKGLAIEVTGENNPYK